MPDLTPTQTANHTEILAVPPPQPTLRLFQFVCGLSLALSAALSILWSLHWPLIGDASLIHYIVFLTQRMAWPPTASSAT